MLSQYCALYAIDRAVVVNLSMAASLAAVVLSLSPASLTVLLPAT